MNAFLVWGRIKHAIILEDPFDDPAGLAELVPDKSPELKPPAEVITSCLFLNQKDVVFRFYKIQTKPVQFITPY
jgi:hypothetical protein